MSASRPFAIVTGASTGIGFELAKRCAKEGYDLLIAADEPSIENAAATLRNNAGDIGVARGCFMLFSNGLCDVDEVVAAGVRKPWRWRVGPRAERG